MCSLRAHYGHSVGSTSARDGLRLGHDLLEAAARLASSWGGGPTARFPAGTATLGQAYGFLSGHCGFFFSSGCRGWSKTGPNPTDRRRPGSKHHLATEAQGIPLAITLTGANRRDVTQPDQIRSSSGYSLGIHDTRLLFDLLAHP